jgi:hypothetical protein
MANTYTLIASNTVGGAGAASITFSSIAATYTDLVIYASPRSARGAVEDELWIRLNGDTGNNYSYNSLSGDGTTASSQAGSSTPAVYRGWMPGNTTTANTFGNHCIYIPNYAGSNYKSLSGDDVSENNDTSARATLRAGLWSNTAAITSVTLLPEVSTFMQYSSFYLYGIKSS